jgi:tetratricopeptide (TPR) repeat protein
MNLGNTCLSQEKYDAAIAYYERIKEKAFGVNHINSTADTIISIGLTYVRTKKYDEAIAHYNYDRALRIYDVSHVRRKSLLQPMIIILLFLKTYNTLVGW